MSEPASAWSPLRHRWGLRMTVTRGVLLAIALSWLTLVGYRLVFGLGAVTNLDDRWPWALWTWWKLGGVALAGAGYSTALCVHFLGRHRWHDIERGAFVVSLLGYLMLCTALILDLGQWYNAWHPFFFWGYHSVMFELFWSVGAYTVIQVVEFLYIFEERVPIRWLHRVLKKVYVPLLILGVIFPFLHQSALNGLYVIAKGKEDPLWWSVGLPLYAVMTSFYVGPAVVTIENFVSHRLYGRPIHMRVLSEMVRMAGFVMLLYLLIKLGDLYARGVFPELFGGSLLGNVALVEIGAGVVVPMWIFLSRRAGTSPTALLTASLLAAAGVVMNRFDITIVGMMRSTGEGFYRPSFLEVWFCVGLAAVVSLAYLFIVENFPVFTAQDVAVAEARRRPIVLRRRPERRSAQAA